MSSLLTEILISLVVIAIIGGIIGWLIRGVQISNREENLENEVSDARGSVDKYTSQIQRLENSMKKLNQLRSSEKDQLENRISELEPLFNIVERRDSRIRELTEQLETLGKERQSELSALQFDASTRALLGEEDTSEIGKLQYELQLANRQKEGAISRYQNQVRQIEDLENVIKEKERKTHEVSNRLEKAELSRARDQEDLLAKQQMLEERLQGSEQQVAMVENKKQYELSLLESKVQQARQLVEEAKTTQSQTIEQVTNEYLTRENALEKQLQDTRSELTDNQAKIAGLEKRLETRVPAKPTAIRAVSKAPSPLFKPDDQKNLQQLRGIGPTTEVKLNKIGIKSLMQIASLKDEDIKNLTKSMPSFSSLAKRHDWIEKAREITTSSANQATRA